jgi:hypothetical protein
MRCVPWKKSSELFGTGCTSKRSVSLATEALPCDRGRR